jgi:hypothetical protein
MISIQLIDTKNDLYQLKNFGTILFRYIGIPRPIAGNAMKIFRRCIKVENDSNWLCGFGSFGQGKNQPQYKWLLKPISGKGISKLLVNELHSFLNQG